MKFAQIILFSITIALLSITSLRAQNDLDSIVTKLNSSQAKPQEKIHIHFDRSNYNKGDTVWLKAYLVNVIGNQLSTLSKVLFINIQSPNGYVKSMALKVDVGMAAGQFFLTDSLYQEGNFNITAYTNLMRNAGNEYFFKYTFPVNAQLISSDNPKIKEPKNIINNPNDQNKQEEKNVAINFFPEGGSLISGIRSKVGFKALDKNGIGVNIKGEVIKNNGERVAVFESGYSGIGIFPMLPRYNETYYAIITEGPNTGQKFIIPKSLQTGFVLSVNALAKDSLNIRISRTSENNQNLKIRLIVQANGEIQKALQIPMSAQVVKFNISKSDIAYGINQITLYTEENSPLAERLVFIRPANIQTEITTDKAEYENREKIKLKISVSDEKHKGIIGGYSLSVVNLNEINIPEENQISIYSNLLLSSDLKGYIENPNYYFIKPDDKKDAELDALLLTQGWRRFILTENINNKVSKNYLAQQAINLKGKVTNMQGVPIAGVKINLFAAKQFLLLDTVTDINGRFAFNDLDFEEEADVILRAKGVKGANNLKIILDEPENLKVSVSEARNIGYSNEQNIMNVTPRATNIDSGKIVQGKTLETVEVISKRRDEIKGSVYPFAAAPPDVTLTPEILQGLVNLHDYLKARFIGVTINGDKVWGRFGKDVGLMVILLNGTAIESLSEINPRALTGVQIVRGGTTALNMATSLMLRPEPNEYKQDPHFGIVILTTGPIDAKYIKLNRPNGFLQTKVLGYTYEREFYSPKYEVQKELPRIDIRPTLYWKPNIITDYKGLAELSFYTSDEKGKYLIVLEGIGANGELVRQTSTIQVK